MNKHFNAKIIFVAIIFMLFSSACSEESDDKTRYFEQIDIGIKNVSDTDIANAYLKLDNGAIIRFGFVKQKTRALNVFYPYFGRTKDIEVVYIYRGQKSYERRKITVKKEIRKKISKDNYLIILVSNKTPEIELVLRDW